MFYFIFDPKYKYATLNGTTEINPRTHINKDRQALPIWVYDIVWPRQ